MVLENNIKMILLEAQKMEKMAEDNCTKILQQLKVNGFHKDITKIKNDEKRHYEMAGKLIQLLKM